MGKLLVFLGLGIAGLGLLMMLGLPIGRLPGDIYVKRDGFSFYFPLTTSITEIDWSRLFVPMSVLPSCVSPRL